MSIKKALLTTAIALCPVASFAFDYNFAQGAFVDFSDADSGLEVSGSYDVIPNTAVIGSYTSFGDASILSAGAAYRLDLGLAQNVSVEAHGEFQRGEVDVAICNFSFCVDASVSDTGFLVGGLMRYAKDDKLEFFGDASYATLFDGDFLLTGGARYSISKNLNVFGSYTLADADKLSLGIRYVLD